MRCAEVLPSPVVSREVSLRGTFLGGGSISSISGGNVGRLVIAGSSGVGGGSSSFISGSGEGLVLLGSNSLGLGAVKVEPPVADEVVLVEDGSVGAQEAVLAQTTLGVGGANVEHLALGLRVGIVTAGNLAVARESGLGNVSKDGVVFAGNAGNRGHQHLESHVFTGGVSSGTLGFISGLVNAIVVKRSSLQKKQHYL